MDKVELLLPAGDRDSLRAAVANGADAVYLGLDAFNARKFADNFRRGTLPSVVDFCHGKGVRVFVTANILVKNHELAEYFELIDAIDRSNADAIIVQDPCLIPFIRERAPHCEIHLSTQATTANRYAIPEGADRVIVPREMGLEQISAMARAIPVEMFVHGALCLSYSGQCLFSSMAGGRSGNRGRCAQPCRQMYNDAYPLSTKDLCLVEKIPEIIKTGAVSLKVEGRMRGPLYVGTVARIYRKYIDMHYTGKFAVDPKDIEDLKMAFNREFTSGFAFNDSIVDPALSMNRGIFLGMIENGTIRLETGLRVGDGVTVFRAGGKSGNTVRRVRVGKDVVEKARKGDVVAIEVKGARNGDRVFKTFSSELKENLGEDFDMVETEFPAKPFRMPKIHDKKIPGPPSLFVKVHSPQGAKEAARAGASVIYYNVFKEDIETAREKAEDAKFFLSAPRVMSDSEVENAADIIKKFRPDGVLVGERGLLSVLGRSGPRVEIHLGQSFNMFNDIDLGSYDGVPVISPELSFNEISALASRRFMVMVQGPMVLMTTKEPIKDDVLRDGAGRRFRTRRAEGFTEILNCSDLGMFNKTREYLAIGVKWFYLDLARDVGMFVRNYKRIISGEPFDDMKIRRGHTTGHFGRGVE